MAKRSTRSSRPRLRLPIWLSRRTEGPAQLSDRELAETFRTAMSAVLDGDYAAAEQAIESAVLADSDDVEPYRALARLYRLRGEIGRAIGLHQNLLLRRNLDGPTRNAVLLELAADFRQGGFLARALASYQEVLGHAPKNPAALRGAAELLADAGDYPQALALRKRLVKVEKRADRPAEARLLTRMAEADHAAGRHDSSRKHAKQALRLDPESSDARVLLGQLEAERGKNKAALAAWQAVAEAGGPGVARVYPLIEASYAALGHARDYETFVRNLLERRPDDATSRIALAATLASRGESAAAVLQLRRVLDADPENIDARVALGRLHLQQDRGPDVIKEFRELLEWVDQRSGRLADLGALDGPVALVAPLPGGASAEETESDEAST